MVIVVFTIFITTSITIAITTILPMSSTNANIIHILMGEFNLGKDTLTWRLTWPKLPHISASQPASAASTGSTTPVTSPRTSSCLGQTDPTFRRAGAEGTTRRLPESWWNGPGDSLAGSHQLDEGFFLLSFRGHSIFHSAGHPPRRKRSSKMPRVGLHVIWEGTSFGCACAFKGNQRQIRWGPAHSERP